MQGTRDRQECMRGSSLDLEGLDVLRNVEGTTRTQLASGGAELTLRELKDDRRV